MPPGLERLSERRPAGAAISNAGRRGTVVDARGSARRKPPGTRLQPTFRFCPWPPLQNLFKPGGQAKDGNQQDQGPMDQKGQQILGPNSFQNVHQPTQARSSRPPAMDLSSLSLIMATSSR